jgi:hypothetical protein
LIESRGPSLIVCYNLNRLHRLGVTVALRIGIFSRRAGLGN